MSKILSPTLIIHGTDDNLSTLKHARVLYEKCPMAVAPLWLPGAEHMRTFLRPEYDEILHFILF